MRRAAIPLILATALAGQTSLPPEDPDKPNPVYTSIVITAKTVEPGVERRNAEVFEKTLFSRDDQVFHLLDAGINAGQHEGGGKSIEIRRFGFNLDHGGVNGGLKVLVDNVQQNQATQGHGQGYLGSLKSLSPELISEVSIVNGPFAAEYGDFSGLGVVHIRLRESLPDRLTVRMQGGSFGTTRGFISYSPDWRENDAFFAYEGSNSDGPFLKPLGYRRDNVTTNWTRRFSGQRAFGLRFNSGRNDYHSSGQIPLDEVAAGRLDRFGYLDSGDGGRVRNGTLAAYYRAAREDGSVLRVDGFLTRSLLDMYSNFTFFLNDPEHGDCIQQHDSRLMEGANLQYLRPHRLGTTQSLFTAGGNFHDNQILVGLYPRVDRTAIGVTTRAHAHVTNGAGYAQESLSLLDGRLQLGGGLRYDLFRFGLNNLADPAARTLAPVSGRWQPKASVAYTPSARWPVTLHANYGRGISSIDARGVAELPHGTHVATTDFYQVGTSYHFRRVSFSTDAFLIDRSNELVYVPDDGSMEFQGPTRAYGFEAKLSLELARRLSFNGGVTKVLDAFYRGVSPRPPVDRAPHFTANAGLTLSEWKGWSGSVRVRAINHYLLDGADPAILASGHTVYDMNLARRIQRGVDFNFAVDNFTNRSYYETQNLLESRLMGQAPAWRIHGTPGYPVTFTAGLTFRLGGK